MTRTGQRSGRGTTGIDASGADKEEILLSPNELVVAIKLRRVLHALVTRQAIDLLPERLNKTRNNTDFLVQIAKTTPGDWPPRPGERRNYILRRLHPVTHRGSSAALDGPGFGPNRGDG